MNSEFYQAFAKYNQLMNNKLYSTTEKLNDEEKYSDKGAFFKSVFSTLEHIMLADILWLLRFKNVPSLTASLSTMDEYPQIQQFSDRLYENFEALKRDRKKLDLVIYKFTQALSEKELVKTFQYRNMAGKNFENILWICVSHFFNHQTHHRGQATTLLTQMGHDVGVTDFPAVLKEEL